jgi:hypothetical protein
MQDHDGTELATQASLAKVEQRLTGTLKEQTEQEPFIGQHSGFTSCGKVNTV